MPLVQQKLSAKASLVGTLEVRRALPQRERRFVGPFCFIDHMGPHTSLGLAGGGVGPHPHIGLATVTTLFDGEIQHHDSLGTSQRITPGDVNWMTAGRGIVHSERTPEDHVGQMNTLHGLQVWVGLPQAQEESAPSFQHAPKASLPQLHEGGLTLRLLLGSWRGARSPVTLASPTLYAVAELAPDASLPLLSEAQERAIYVVEGVVELDGGTLHRGELAVLTPGQEGALTAITRARVALFGGEPLDGPRFMLWNFVSSRKERLEQAKDDWIHRRFPSIPGDDVERVPFPGEGA